MSLPSSDGITVWLSWVSHSRLLFLLTAHTAGPPSAVRALHPPQLTHQCWHVQISVLSPFLVSIGTCCYMTSAEGSQIGSCHADLSLVLQTPLSDAFVTSLLKGPTQRGPERTPIYSSSTLPLLVFPQITVRVESPTPAQAVSFHLFKLALWSFRSVLKFPHGGFACFSLNVCLVVLNYITVGFPF